MAALANCISDEAHGGAIIIVPSEKTVGAKDLRVKYRTRSSILRDTFVAYMNVRHRVVDFIVRMEQGETAVKAEWGLAELELAECHAQLVEAIRFVARLAGCDGAIVISDDLRLLGFGAEIRSELTPKAKVVEVEDEVRRVFKPLDIEQSGLRHRSAIKLVSRRPSYYVLVISQDGPVSVVWSEKPKIVNVKRGVNLVNMNMPWA